MAEVDGLPLGRLLGRAWVESTPEAVVAPVGRPLSFQSRTWMFSQQQGQGGVEQKWKQGLCGPSRWLGCCFPLSDIKGSALGQNSVSFLYPFSPENCPGLLVNLSHVPVHLYSPLTGLVTESVIGVFIFVEGESAIGRNDSESPGKLSEVEKNQGSHINLPTSCSCF